MGRWRTACGAVAVSLGVTAAVATVAEAGVAQPPHPPVVAVHPASAAAVPAALGEVTVHDLDLAVVAPTLDPAPSVVQEIHVSVVGGDLSLGTTAALVVLEQVSGREWVGVLPPVRVVDARGTHEGWDVRWSVAGIDLAGTERGAPKASVRIEPHEPVVVAGLAEGVAAGEPGPGVGRGRTLVAAEAGWGGGTYEADGTITVRLPDGVDANGVTVHLTFDLA